MGRMSLIDWLAPGNIFMGKLSIKFHSALDWFGNMFPCFVNIRDWLRNPEFRISGIIPDRIAPEFTRIVFRIVTRVIIKNHKSLKSLQSLKEETNY
jgi:hypothetical protein